MAKFLLALHAGGGERPAHRGRPATIAQDRAKSQDLMAALEAELQQEGAWVVSARLTSPDVAVVVRPDRGKAHIEQGPFVASGPHLAGFYVIEAPDHDAAVSWATRVASVVGAPIEVRRFAGWV